MTTLGSLKESNGPNETSVGKLRGVISVGMRGQFKTIGDHMMASFHPSIEGVTGGR